MIDLLKKRILEATKSGKTKERDLLKTVLGDIQLRSATKEIKEEECVNIVRKFISNNLETIKLCAGRDLQISTDGLKEENDILETLLPKFLNYDEVMNVLKEQALLEQITAANEGKAVGLAMKEFKQRGLNVDGNIVKSVVQNLRF